MKGGQKSQKIDNVFYELAPIEISLKNVSVYINPYKDPFWIRFRHCTYSVANDNNYNTLKVLLKISEIASHIVNPEKITDFWPSVNSYKNFKGKH